MNLYFECNSGISGDMSTGALLDLGAEREKLDCALNSIKLNDEFEYIISKKPVNGIMATDFDVILKQTHHHIHRNLKDVYEIIDRAKASNGAKTLAKKIFKITAEAESKVHNKPVDEIHFHEVGAIDSIADVLGFSVLFDNLSPKKVYFSTLTDGKGFVNCAHGKIPVPVPAVLEIVSKYKLPLKISDNDGEMVTPTGASIAAALYTGEKLPDEIIIEKTGYGRGKRPYQSPILRVIKIKGE